jgi:hypothetical protein
MKPSNKTLLNLLAASAFIAVAGWDWDGWWHVALGRDRLFSPPHVLQYIYLFTLFACALLLYRRTKERVYMQVLLLESITLVSGLFDILWHNVFGVERLISPLIVWSPPHLVAMLSTTVGMILLMRHRIRRYHSDHESLDFFRIVLLSGAAFAMANIITSPLAPLGWHNVAGLWGIAATMLVASYFLLYIGYSLPNTGIVTLTALALLIFMGFEAVTVAPGQLLPPHAKTPHWLYFFATIPAVLWLDFITIRKWRPEVLGAVTTTAISLIYFLFWNFIQSTEFNYSRSDARILVLASSLGGLCAGILYKKIRDLYHGDFPADQEGA